VVVGRHGTGIATHGSFLIRFSKHPTSCHPCGYRLPLAIHLLSCPMEDQIGSQGRYIVTLRRCDRAGSSVGSWCCASTGGVGLKQESMRRMLHVQDVAMGTKSWNPIPEAELTKSRKNVSIGAGRRNVSPEWRVLERRCYLPPPHD